MAKNTGLLTTIPSIAFRHKVLFLSIFLTVMGLTVVYVSIAKKQYGSSMQIEVQNTRATQTVSSEKGSQQGAGMSPDELESHVNSEIELLNNPDLMQHLVVFRSALVPNTKAPVPGSVEMAHEILKLSNRLTVNPVRKSAIIGVTYRDYSPQLAQAILQELQSKYLEKHILLQRPAGTSEFFARETDSATKQRQEAEQSLATFQADNGFVSLSGEKQLLAENLDKAKTAVLQDQVDLTSSQKQFNDLQQQLVRTPQRIQTTQRTSPNNYVMMQLITQLTDLRNRRIQLAARYLPTDRLVTEVDDQIRVTQKTLDDTIASESVEKAMDNNPSWLALDLQLKSQQTSLAGLRARFAEHHAQEEKYEDRLDHLQQITATNNALEQRVNELTANQALLVSKRDAAKVDDLLDVDRFGNVAISLQPTFSYQLAKPAKVLDLVLGFATAIVLCFAVGILLETTRNSILTPAELEASTGIPVFATVPESRALAAITGNESRPNPNDIWLSVGSQKG